MHDAIVAASAARPGIEAGGTKRANEARILVGCVIVEECAGCEQSAATSRSSASPATSVIAQASPPRDFGGNGMNRLTRR
jgi:hypothetical protein